MPAARTFSGALICALLCSLATTLLVPALARADPPPGPLIAAPLPGSFTSSQLPAFAGSTGDLQDALTLELFGGEAAEGVPLQTLSAQPDTVSGDWTASPSSALEPGTYTALALQVPESGPLLQSPPVIFTVDPRAPAVGIAAPPAFGNDPTPSFAGPAGTEPGDEAVTLSVHRGSSLSGPLASEGPAIVSGGRWSWVSAHLKDGLYTVQATQRDAAGNVGYSAALTFTLDTLAPDVTLTSPAFGALLYEARPVFAGAAGEAPGDEPSVTVRIYADGPEHKEALAETLEGLPLHSGIWSSAATGPELPDGLYSAVAEQRDEAGNIAVSAASTFLVATAPTPISIIPSLLSGSSLGAATAASAGRTAAGAAAAASPLGPAMMQPFPVVRIAGSDTLAGARLSLLTVQAPAGARILLSCRGTGCPVHRLSVLAGAGSHRPPGATAIVVFHRFQRALRAGVTLEIRVTGGGQIGKYTRFSIRRGALPLRFDTCLDPLGQKPIVCPA